LRTQDMSQAVQAVLILGAGELGNSILARLARHPSRGSGTITVLLRKSAIRTGDPSKRVMLDGLKTLKIDFLEGDVVDQSTAALAELFRPFDTIIAATGMTFPAGTQIKICNAVLHAGLKRYIPWQFGVDYEVIGKNSSQNPFTEQLDVRALLRSQKRTEWIILSTGMFTSFLFEPVFGVVQKDPDGSVTVNAIGGKDNRVTVTTPQDIGKMTAEVVFRWWEEYKNGVVFLSGDTRSYGRLALDLEKMIGRKVALKEVTVQMLMEQLTNDPKNGIRQYRAVFGDGVGVAWDKERTLNYKKGFRLQNLAEWLQENWDVD